MAGQSKRPDAYAAAALIAAATIATRTPVAVGESVEEADERHARRVLELAAIFDPPVTPPAEPKAEKAPREKLSLSQIQAAKRDQPPKRGRSPGR